MGEDWLKPEWDKACRINDWRNYISDELKEMWDTFTPEQKKAIRDNADEMASGEIWE